MSSEDIAIRVQDLGKCYQIYDRPEDRLKQSLLPRVRRLIGQPSPNYFREFWALRGISFDVRKGETVGIIGRNGSGKSTLLQLICGTLTPTTGTVETTGRVAALLELGAGFNPEFTGRENVYLNGCVLGLRRDEIDARFDAILAFADIGKFIEQPVKTYSSGMFVRLAFAVAANVDAEILIVDEALSVGDMYFQAKCINHMKSLINSGATVLFVSHDTHAVKALCERAIYLDQGNLAAAGSTEDVVEVYFGSGVTRAQPTEGPTYPAENVVAFDPSALAAQEEFARRASFHRLQNDKAEFLDVYVLDDLGNRITSASFGQRVALRMLFRTNVELPCIGLAYHIRDRNGFDVIYSDTALEDSHLNDLKAGEVIRIDWAFNMCLREGDYSVAAMLSIPEDLSIAKVEVCDFVPIAANVQVRRGSSLPLHGAVHWQNTVTHTRYTDWESRRP